MRKLLAINSVLLFAVTLTWLVPFYGICTNGTHTVYEPNSFVLGLEVAVFVLIMAVALMSMVYVIISARSN